MWLIIIMMLVFLASRFFEFKKPVVVDTQKTYLTIYYGQAETNAVVDFDANGIAYITAWFEDPADTLTRKENEGKRLNVGPARIEYLEDTGEVLSWTLYR